MSVQVVFAIIIFYLGFPDDKHLTVFNAGTLVALLPVRSMIPPDIKIYLFGEFECYM